MADLLDDSSVASNDAQEKIKVLFLFVVWLWGGRVCGLCWCRVWLGLVIGGIVSMVYLFMLYLLYLYYICLCYTVVVLLSLIAPAYCM